MVEPSLNLIVELSLNFNMGRPLDAAPLNGRDSALDIALDNGRTSKINASNKVIEALYH